MHPRCDHRFPVPKRNVRRLSCTLGLICAYTKFFFEGRKRAIVMESMLAGKLILVGMKHNPGSTMAADTFWATVS